MKRYLIAAAIVIGAVQPVAAEVGVASKYGSENGQHRRADGKPYHPWQIGCAHKTRRLGSVVRVTNLATGRSIRCMINDRGPFVRGRILDLSFGAARALGMKGGLLRVRVE